eukprot:CAMPEP_0179064116 /NCGR_PEP_ID=MMETSP0796-20121207/27783_1 /TAXON_ID=73915 /ORGANISM="Pyrodinium bahamense, Strain pbaha01" /LENGTH=409 /DNA_ID=CAMNT_0020761055 /DNA_START=79 /DNA_END=1309 /DNA_ORIENTATION=+
MLPAPGQPAARNLAPARTVPDMFLFVNPKSGGNRGEAFMEVPQPFITDLPTGQQVNLRIFSLLDGESGNKPGFLELKKALRQQAPIRVVVGGGDGTVMWVDTEATKHGIDSPSQLLLASFRLAPATTSPVAGWGGRNPSGFLKNDCEGLRKLVRKWCAGRPRPHDVWQVTLNVNESSGEILHVGKEKDEVPIDGDNKSLSLPMINYFSIGQESKVGMEFDKHRTKSQTCNLFVYAFEGIFTEMECCSQQHVGNLVAGLHMGTSSAGQVILDSRGDTSLPELIGNPESLMFLNVNSYAGGNAHFWQLDTKYGVDPRPSPEFVDVQEDPGDGRLEVVTLPNIVNIPLDRIDRHAKRVHSGAPYYVEFFEDEDEGLDAFCEVDGEFYHLVNPESVTIVPLKRLQVLQKEETE